MNGKMSSWPRATAWFAALSLALLLNAAPSGASATELVYTPVNPNFGGSALNGSALLNAAQAQNKTKDPDALTPKQSTQQSALQQFNDMLERSVLNRLASAAMGGIVKDGVLVEGPVETGKFTIDIIDLGGGVLQVTTTDKVTGASTSFQVGQP